MAIHMKVVTLALQRLTPHIHTIEKEGVAEYSKAYRSSDVSGRCDAAKFADLRAVRGLQHPRGVRTSSNSAAVSPSLFLEPQLWITRTDFYLYLLSVHSITHAHKLVKYHKQFLTRVTIITNARSSCKSPKI